MVGAPTTGSGGTPRTAARCASPTLFRGISRRCGKCPWCVNVTRWLKESLALWEAYGSARTWFVTLTFAEKPATEKEAYAHVQKWLKVVRINLDRKKGERIRFIAVSEYGTKASRLHYHLLLFVGSGVVYRDLPDWSHGHFKYKLADSKAIAYVMKYMTKSGVKFRASQKMGQEVSEKIRSHPLVRAVQDAFPGARIVEVRHKGRKVALRKEGKSPEQEKAQESLRLWTEQFIESLKDKGVRDNPCDVEGDF